MTQRAIQSTTNLVELGSDDAVRGLVTELTSIVHCLGLHNKVQHGEFSMETIGIEIIESQAELQLAQTKLNNQKSDLIRLQDLVSRATMKNNSLKYEKAELEERVCNSETLQTLQNSTETLLAKHEEYQENIRARINEQEIRSLGISDRDLQELETQLERLNEKRQDVKSQRSRFGKLEPNLEKANQQCTQLEEQVRQLDEEFDRRISEFPM